MARIRTVKPDFFTDEKLAECSRDARLLFVGLIVHADDAGRMAYSAKRVAMQVFPGDQVDVSPWIGELTTQGIICLYEVDDHRYLSIPNFNRHQKVNKPTPSRYPAPAVVPRGTPENSRVLLNFPEDSSSAPENSGEVQKIVCGTGTGTGTGINPLPPLGIQNVESQKQNQTTEQGTPHGLPAESLAHKVIEVFHLNNAKNVLVAIAGAIKAMAGEKGVGISEGLDALIEITTRAQAAGVPIDYLWFLNTGWRKWEAKQVKGAEPKKRPKSPMDQLREQEETVRRERAERAARQAAQVAAVN